MTVTSSQLALIKSIDTSMQSLLIGQANDETVLITMAPQMEAIKSELLDKLPKKELELYCQEYSGFYQLIKTLENLAKHIKSGRINF